MNRLGPFGTDLWQAFIAVEMDTTLRKRADDPRTEQCRPSLVLDPAGMRHKGQLSCKRRRRPQFTQTNS